MKRCVDSGLWVPEANKEPEGAKEEEVYDEVQESEPLVGNDINDVD